uniref:L1 transposable element RRM domain-containing protein n=1 Tax=Pipistrellus kuhlii TaxID=59472 RepID=A0A7J7UAA4_PIPKU|nr:hypothetical protein mPipKuh1_009162 [Pipistrellus kuhlii]
MIIRWLKRMEDKLDNMSKNQEEMKKNQEEMKNDIATVKNSIESIKSRPEEAEDCISELEDKLEKNTQLEQLLGKKIKKQEESLRELWDNTKQNNIRIIGVPEGKETEEDMENVFQEIMAENFPEMEKKKPTQIQDARRVPSKMNCRRPTPRHIIIKLANTNDKIRILFIYFFKIYFIDFTQRGIERDRELETSMRENHRSAASCTPPTGDVPTTKVHALDRNRTWDLSVRRPTLYPLSQTGPGQNKNFKSSQRETESYI